MLKILQAASISIVWRQVLKYLRRNSSCWNDESTFDEGESLLTNRQTEKMFGGFLLYWEISFSPQFPNPFPIFNSFNNSKVIQSIKALSSHFRSLIDFWGFSYFWAVDFFFFSFLSNVSYPFRLLKLNSHQIIRNNSEWWPYFILTFVNNVLISDWSIALGLSVKFLIINPLHPHPTPSPFPPSSQPFSKFQLFNNSK